MFNQQICTLVRNVAGTLQPARGLLGRTSSCKQISSPITVSSSDEEHTHTYSHTASAVNSSPHCHHVCTGGYLSLERTAGTYLSLNSLHVFFFLNQTLHSHIWSYLLLSVDFPAHQLVQNSKPLTRKIIAFTQYFTHYINQWILLR